MKISFINKNDKKEYDINSFFLSKTNPRYTLLNSIDQDLTEFITKMNNEKNYEEKEEFEKLLIQEGDFSDLLELLKSIKEVGFKNGDHYEPPIYVVNGTKKDSFIVAEGNRRLMCLKLMAQIYKLPESEFFLNKANNYSN